MELFIYFFIGYLVGWVLMKAGGGFLNYLDKRQAVKAAMKPEIAAYDEDGHRKEYDPHYTRELEQTGGVKVVTRCDNTKCAKCYWKPRMLKTSELKLHGMIPLMRKRDEFIESLPDDYSDDLYQMFYDDWLKDQEPTIQRHKREKEEDYYCTPYDQIQKYKTEGRVFNKANNSWSGIPKDSKPKRAMAIDNDMSITQWRAEAERLKKEILALANTSGNLDPNPIVDMKVEYEWDLKSGQHYRNLISIHKNGGKAFKREPVSKKEYDDWRN